MNIENEIKKFALENAIKFKGKANKKAVISKVLGLGPDIKNDMKNITGQIDKILEEVNALDLDSQKQELLKLNPDFETEQKEKKAAQKQAAEELPPLKNAVMGKVITRMPPEPSKYSHVGHALSFLINYMYAQNYQGQCILRFEDTNPEKESKEFADAIKGDVLDYLDIKPSKTLYASDDMDKFYKLADQLVQSNHAYVCSCPSEQISKDRRAMTECPHRMQRLDLNMKLWKEMLQGKSKEYVLRLLIDMRHKNAVMRDPVIFRVIDQEHYRQKSKFKVWPMYDFENAVEDGLCKVTHVMRSNEFDTRIELQTYILRLLGMPEIEYKHYGRFNITGALTQGRKIREGIEKGEFVGWDDPRLVTLKALKRRGIVKETLYKLAKTCGMSKTQSNIDYSVIASINRNILDASAKRFFFVKNPVQIKIKGAPSLKLDLDMHPELKLGNREMHLHEDYMIEKADFDNIKEGEIIRLIDNLNFKKKGTEFEFDSDDYKKFKAEGKHIIHFLPNTEEQWVDVEIMMPDAKPIKGKAEHNIKKLEVGEVVQFQRFGFCRFDKKEKGVYKFWYAHD